MALKSTHTHDPVAVATPPAGQEAQRGAAVGPFHPDTDEH